MTGDSGVRGEMRAGKMAKWLEKGKKMASEAKHTDGCERQKVTKAATAISSVSSGSTRLFLGI